MTNPYRAMCAELAEEVERLWSVVRDDNNEPHSLANRARALLAQPVAAGGGLMEETYSHEHIEVLLQRLKELRELQWQEKRIERRAMAEHRK